MQESIKKVTDTNVPTFCPVTKQIAERIGRSKQGSQLYGRESSWEASWQRWRPVKMCPQKRPRSLGKPKERTEDGGKLEIENEGMEPTRCGSSERHWWCSAAGFEKQARTEALRPQSPSNRKPFKSRHGWVVPVYSSLRKAGLLLSAYLTLCSYLYLTQVPPLICNMSYKVWSNTHSLDQMNYRSRVYDPQAYRLPVAITIVPQLVVARCASCHHCILS